jgi:hypothetical protein
MNDRLDGLIRRAAELTECSLRARSTTAELRAENEELAYRLAEAQKAGTRVLRQLEETVVRACAAAAGRLPGRVRMMSKPRLARAAHWE